MKPMTALLYKTVSARTGRLAAVKPDPVRLLLWLGLGGAVLGVLLYDTVPKLRSLPFLMQGMAVSDAPRTLWDVFLTALLPLLLLTGCILICGLSACGQPMLLALLLLRGFAAGLAAADCMAQYPFRQGLYASAVLILPFAYLSLLLTVFAVRDALSLSGMMTCCLLRGHADGEPGEIRRKALLGILRVFLLSVPVCGLQTLLLWRLNDTLLP